MAEWILAPGPATAIARDRVLAVVDGDGAEAAAERVRVALDADPGAGLPALLDAVVGGRIHTAPAFLLCVDTGAALAVAARGDLGARIVVGDDERPVHGRGLSSWRELRVPDAERVLVAATLHPAPAPAPTPTGALPGATDAAADDPSRTRTYVDTDPSVAGLIDAVPIGAVPAPFTASAPTDLDESSSGVTGIVCVAGHPNPLARSTCARCGVALAGAGVARVHHPDLGVVVLPDGREIALGGTILVGRSPRAETSDGRSMPTLVTVDHRDVSRTHLRITTDAWSVLVEDLGATNGTLLIEPGGGAARLRPGQPAIVVDGAVAALGDGARLSFKGVP